MIIAVVGYAKSGKTLFGEALVRAARAGGRSVAVLKTGRAGHGAASAVPDNERLLRAGASPSVFWSAAGVEVRRPGIPVPDRHGRVPLPARSVFAAQWRELLPPTVGAELDAVDLLLIEGRAADGATVVQMRRGLMAEPDSLKYPVERCDFVVPDAGTIGRVVHFILGKELHEQ